MRLDDDDPMLDGGYRIDVPGLRPFTLNAERKLSPRDRAALVRTWREAAAWSAFASGAPRPIARQVHVVVQAVLKHRFRQDTAGCFPTAKAAIDGLVDAGLLAGDGPDVVVALTFYKPEIGAAEDSLILYVLPMDE